MRLEGFDCKSVPDGQQALDLLQTERYDVIVGDLRIPDGEGGSFCLKLLQAAQNPPTIILVDEGQANIVQPLKSRGAADVCVKPVNPVDLISMIKKQIGQGGHGKPTAPKSTASPTADAAANPEAAATEARRVVTVLIKDKTRRAELTEQLAALNVDAVAAEGSEDLYQQLNQQRIDLVVIEHELGGFLTGIEILERLAADLIRPESILLAEPTDRIKSQAAELGVKTIIDPQGDIAELVASIDKLSADVGKRSEMIPPRARKMVQDFDGIPPLPQLVLKLTRYMAMSVEEIPVKELTNDISYDPNAISELLKLTNSASMGLRNKVTKVGDAVSLLGPKRTISLIIASATISAQSQLLKTWSQDLRKWYYKRSVLVASAAATFAEKLEEVSADSAFVLGLLQDVGMLVLASNFGEPYTAIVERSREVGQIRMHQLETKEFKLAHPAVSAALLQKWKFPQSLIGPILDHHDDAGDSERSNLENSLLRSMRIGEALADLADLAHPVRRQNLNRLLDFYGNEMAGKCRKCLADAIAKSTESCKLFSLPVPDADEMQQLVDTISSSE